MSTSDLIIRLESLTVFEHEVLKIKSNADLDAAEAWLKSNAKQPWRIHNRGVWFQSPKDAMNFKLKYG